MSIALTQVDPETFDKDVPWYTEDIDLTPSAREFLEKYTGIAPDKLIPHILKVRNRAWAVWPYPCLGEFRFLDPSIATSPYFQQVVERLKNGDTFLDLGMCFGQDSRKLVSEGVPSENIFGSDLREAFIEMGYELFQDRNRLQSRFIVADVFDPDSELKQLDGKIDVIYAGAFFHLFKRDEQLQIAKRMVQIVRPKKGSMIFGRQAGSIRPGDYPHITNAGGIMHRHDAASWEKLWKEVGEATGTKWEVDAALDDGENMGRNAKSGQWLDEGTRRLVFAVHRL